MARPIQLIKKVVWFWDGLQVGSVVNSLAGNRSDQRAALAFRYFSWKKLFNVLRVEAQLRLGRRKVWGSAFEWTIDTTNICQLKCPLCHTGLGTIDRDKGIMHFETYTKTIDQIKDYCVWLSLYSWGEPFLNRRIHEFVAYAHQNRIATIMSTNLVKPLSPEMTENIIKSGLDVLIVSLDGVTQEVYEKYRVGGRLDRVLDNLRLLVQKKKELGYATPHVEWQFHRYAAERAPDGGGPPSSNRDRGRLSNFQKRRLPSWNERRQRGRALASAGSIRISCEMTRLSSRIRKMGVAAGAFGVAP